MNRTTNNIDNLTSLWRVAGTAFQGYIQNRVIFSSIIENAEWPNRIWTDQSLNLNLGQEILEFMIGRPEIVFSHFDSNKLDDELLANLGLQPKSKQYGMSLLLNTQFETQKNLNFKRTKKQSEFSLWSEIFEKAFGYGINPEILAKTWKQIPYYLIFDDHEPVGTIILYKTGHVAGVHSLGILPQRRKQGYATEIMKHTLNMALDKGATLATLQASEMAKNLYTKMGFSLDFTMTNYYLPSLKK